MLDATDGRPGDGAPSTLGAAQAVTLSLFRFDTAWEKHWALWQMLLSRWKLKALPDIQFMKMVGTGTREGFYPYPNLGVYGVLAAWPSLAHAQAQVEGAAVFRNYRRHAAEALTLYLTPVQAKGAWSGRAPFAPESSLKGRLPVAALTRATVKPRHALSFWARTPGIRAEIPDQPHLLFKIGMAEVPWVNQITFTIWDDLDAMRAFAYRPGGPHTAAIEAARSNGWFAEELYARFHVAGKDGSWSGAPRLDAL
jgi:spheroidene monooxygenase